jgi:hypothetical protein
LGFEGLAGKSGSEGPDGVAFGSARGPFETVGADARSDLKRDVFFLGTGALDSTGAVRSTMSPIGADCTFLGVGVGAAAGGFGAGEISRS